MGPGTFPHIIGPAEGLLHERPQPAQHDVYRPCLQTQTSKSLPLLAHAPPAPRPQEQAHAGAVTAGPPRCGWLGHQQAQLPAAARSPRPPLCWSGCKPSTAQ